MKEISVSELKSKIDEKSDFQLIDVRETHEYDFSNIGAENIPMGEVPARAGELKEDVPLIVMCRSGKRSAGVVVALERMGFENVYNLTGGILAWAEEIDPALKVK